MHVLVERIELKSDSRGIVYEPATATELAGQQNSHVVITLPGGIRGNHFHKQGTEIAVQGGPARVCYRDGTGTHEQLIDTGEFVKFTIPPGCPHAFENNGAIPNFLVAFNSVPLDPEAPDVFREELIPSPMPAG